MQATISVTSNVFTIPSTVTYRRKTLRLSDYQRQWIDRITNGVDAVEVIVGARHSSKTFVLAVASVMLATRINSFLISYVPGGKMEQAKEFMRYFKAICPKRLRDTRHWSETEARLLNGSRVRIMAPTENGVESARANLLIVDEAQLMDREIFDMALPQLGGEWSKVVVAGTTKYPSLLNDLASGKESTFVNWRAVVEAGIVSEATMLAIKETMSEEAWEEFYECRWVD